MLVIAIISAILPDIDVLAFHFGIPYLHPLGHRGFTHSIVFALLWAFVLSFVFRKGRQLISGLIIFMSTISHGVLDACTTGGKGVGFLVPFSHERFFFPFQFIKVSPIGVSRFFSEWGIKVLLNELKYIALPCFIVLLFSYVLKLKVKLSKNY